MEIKDMSWSKKTENLWKAFENAVLTRDKKQFEIFNLYKKSKEKEVKQQTQEDELIL